MGGLRGQNASMTDRPMGGPVSPPTNAPESGRTSSETSSPGWFSRLIARAYTLRGQLIVPYALLTLVTAMLGTYVVTRLVTSSVRERFVNQLYEASRVAADGVVRRERSHLRALRLMTFTAGVPEAIQSGSAESLESLLLPIALNEQTESVVAIDLRGREVLGLTLDSSEAGYAITGGSDFSDQPIVVHVLEGRCRLHVAGGYGPGGRSQIHNEPSHTVSPLIPRVSGTPLATFFHDRRRFTPHRYFRQRQPVRRLSIPARNCRYTLP